MKFLKLKLLAALFLLGIAYSQLVTVASASTEGKKSLVIMLDGLRADGIINASTPAMDSLIDGTFGSGYQGSFAYYAQTIQDAPTSSAYNHASIMTGVGGQHGVNSNNAAGFQNVDYNVYPTYLTTLESAESGLNTVFLATWSEDFAMVTGADYEKDSDDVGNVANLIDIIGGTYSDASGTNNTSWVAGTDVDAIALFLDDIDAAGHANGFNADIPAYIAEIEAVDAQIGQILAAIEARPGFANEDWQIVITTDHGGDDGGHGAQLPNQETIPFIVAGKAASQGLLAGTVINFDAAATVIAHVLGNAAIPVHYEGVPQSSFVTAPPPTDLTDSLFLYLPFDGDFLDASGNGNNASIGAGSDHDPIAHSSGGLIGGHVEINDLGGGVTDASYLTLGNPADLEFGTDTDFTITTWFRAQADQSGDPVILGNKDWVSGLNVGVLLLADEGNGDDFGFNISDGTRRRDVESVDYSFNQWWFQAATVDRDGNAIMFVGSHTGELFVISDFADDLGDLSSPLPWNIGQDGLGTYAHNLDGDIDEMAVWRRTLTLGEIQQIYNGGAGIDLGDLLSGNNTPPTAGFTYSATNLTVDFTDTSTDSDGTIASWSWEFGDGNSSTAQNPTHVYAAEGTYTVSLAVSDNDSASDTVTTSVMVTAPNVAPPAAPTNLALTVHASGKGKNKVITGVDLTWADNSNNEDGFKIERCEETGRGKNKSCPWSEIAVLPNPDVSSYSDSPGNGTFKYRVGAYNSEGDSAYSNAKKT